MRMRDDGSVQPSSLPTYQNAGREEDQSMYRCMVTKVIFVDDPANITANSTNPRVLYELVVLGGYASGQVISNARLSSQMGGEFNFYERVLRAASKNISKTKLVDNDGDIVFVQFVQGHTAYPVIMSLDNGIKTDPSIGAKIADGQSLKWQYNGIFVEIDKLGDLTLTRKGGKMNDETKAFVPAKNGKEIKLKFEKQKVTLTLKGGLVVVIDGETDSLTATTSGGAELKIDGDTGAITAQDNAGGRLKISESKVGLGTSANELVDLLAQTLQALSVATYPGFGAPASNVADYATLMAKVNLIKGGV